MNLHSGTVGKSLYRKPLRLLYSVYRTAVFFWILIGMTWIGGRVRNEQKYFCSMKILYPYRRNGLVSEGQYQNRDEKSSHHYDESFS